MHIAYSATYKVHTMYSPADMDCGVLQDEAERSVSRHHQETVQTPSRNRQAAALALMRTLLLTDLCGAACLGFFSE